jgi:hypothetical protein
MFLDQLGEHIADVMTLNRSLASIPSASAILDTSNYTFQAITYGKDANGFKYHAHEIISPSGDGIIKVVSYDSTSFSGYTPRATARALSFYYKQYPESFSPLQTRLESKSTLPNYVCGVPDVGHYLNPTINPTLSSFAHLIGGVPAASGSKYKIFNTSGGVITSGTLAQSVYNLSGIMDSSGFLTFLQAGLAIQQVAYTLSESNLDLFGYGVIRSAEAGFPSEVSLKWFIPPGECGAFNLFGGIFHLGLWCLDIKEMLRAGYYPPYSFNPLNNIRKYRLVAKKTFNRDLITYSGNSAFKELFQDITGFDDPKCIVVGWAIRFV